MPLGLSPSGPACRQIMHALSLAEHWEPKAWCMGDRAGWQMPYDAAAALLPYCCVVLHLLCSIPHHFRFEKAPGASHSAGMPPNSGKLKPSCNPSSPCSCASSGGSRRPQVPSCACASGTCINPKILPGSWSLRILRIGVSVGVGTAVTTCLGASHNGPQRSMIWYGRSTSPC